MAEIMNRNQWLNQVKNKLGDVEVAVEVGVWAGSYSKLIMQNLNPTQFYGVDPYVIYNDAPPGSEFSTQESLDVLYEKINRKIKPGILIRDFSIEAAKQFEDESIDFVYLDGDHTYEAVSSDIAAWYPKVKKNGIISGHDYIEGNKKRGHIYGIIPAVTEFCEKYDKKIETTSEEFATWWTIK